MATLETISTFAITGTVASLIISELFRFENNHGAVGDDLIDSKGELVLSFVLISGFVGALLTGLEPITTEISMLIDSIKYTYAFEPYYTNILSPIALNKFGLSILIGWIYVWREIEDYKFWNLGKDWFVPVFGVLALII